MKYLDWLKTNPEKGYYWVKYQDCDEERIDEFTDWYDNAGNKETRFTDQPDEVISGRLTYDEYMMTKDCVKTVFEAAQRETRITEKCERLEKQLAFAVEALKDTYVICFRNKDALLHTPEHNIIGGIERDCAIALQQIKELNKTN